MPSGQETAGYQSWDTEMSTSLSRPPRAPDDISDCMMLPGATDCSVTSSPFANSLPGVTPGIRNDSRPSSKGQTAQNYAPYRSFKVNSSWNIVCRGTTRQFSPRYPGSPKSWRQRQSPPATAQRWHLRLGHPEPDALRHLVNAAVGVRMINLQGTRRKRNRRKKRSSSRRAVPAPAAAYSAVQTAGSEEAPGDDCVGPNQDCPAELTEAQKAALDAEKQHVPPSKTHCDACAMAKATRSEYRKPRDLSAYKPGERIAIDFHDFERDADGFKSMTLITCRVSGYMW
ncbi:hypothetical protein N657DRAFT_154081, partial [Parathielavia appendiculata]